MIPYIERMYFERFDLKDKIKRAEDFVNSNPKISLLSISLLKSQISFMKGYLDILELRIKVEDSEEE